MLNVSLVHDSSFVDGTAVGSKIIRLQRVIKDETRLEAKAPQELLNEVYNTMYNKRKFPFVVVDATEVSAAHPKILQAAAKKDGGVSAVRGELLAEAAIQARRSGGCYGTGAVDGVTAINKTNGDSLARRRLNAAKDQFLFLMHGDGDDVAVIQRSLTADLLEFYRETTSSGNVQDMADSMAQFVFVCLPIPEEHNTALVGQKKADEPLPLECIPIRGEAVVFGLMEALLNGCRLYRGEGSVFNAFFGTFAYLNIAHCAGLWANVADVDKNTATTNSNETTAASVTLPQAAILLFELLRGTGPECLATSVYSAFHYRVDTHMTVNGAAGIDPAATPLPPRREPIVTDSTKLEMFMVVDIDRVVQGINLAAEEAEKKRLEAAGLNATQAAEPVEATKTLLSTPVWLKGHLSDKEVGKLRAELPMVELLNNSNGKRKLVNLVAAYNTEFFQAPYESATWCYRESFADPYFWRSAQACQPCNILQLKEELLYEAAFIKARFDSVHYPTGPNSPFVTLAEEQLEEKFGGECGLFHNPENRSMLNQLPQVSNAIGEVLSGTLEDGLVGRVGLDVGCGTAIITEHLASAVGTSGKIIGQEISKGFVELSKKRLKAVPQVSFALTPQDSLVGVPSGVVDFAIVCDVYHHLVWPALSLREIRRVLKPVSGILVIVDFQRDKNVHTFYPDNPTWVLEHVRGDRQNFTDEICECGFRVHDKYPDLLGVEAGENYYMVFQPNV